MAAELPKRVYCNWAIRALIEEYVGLNVNVYLFYEWPAGYEATATFQVTYAIYSL